MSADAMTTTTQSPPPPLPEPEQASPSQLDADPNVKSAIRFLQDPRVKNAPLESQIRFLKGKFLSDVQIKHAFSKVGRVVTAEKIASVRAPVSPNAALAGQAAANNAEGAMPTQLQSRPLSPVVPPSQPQYSQTLFPRTPPPPPEEPQTKGVDWRDVVIGTGAAILAGVAGFKLFNRYSPYEIRRKSDRKLSRAFRAPYSSRQRPIINGSSESETDGSSFPPPQLRQPPLPPPPPTEVAAIESAAAAATAAVPGAEAGDLEKLQVQLDETKEALTNERKKCADLAVSSAKIRAEKQQLSRINDRLTQQIDVLKRDIEKLEEEKAAGGKLTATEEEPPRRRMSLTETSPVMATAPHNTPAIVQTPPEAAPAVAAPEATSAPSVPATAATVVSTPPAATLPAAPSTSLPAPQPVLEAAPTPAAAPVTLTAEATQAAVPAPVPVSAPAPDADVVAPSNLAAVVPPAFLTLGPIKSEGAVAAPPS